MTDTSLTSLSSAKRWASSLGPLTQLSIATLLAIPFVFFSTFNGFQWFDDEGTLLIGFHYLIEGRRMYDDIYSLYGPLYNAVYGFIYGILHVPLTQTAGRLMAAALWLTYTAAFALWCYQVTRSRVTMVFGYLFALVWLKSLMDSPGHPEELCLILLACVFLCICSIERGRDVAILFGIGAAASGLFLVKINFGAFVTSALVLVLLQVTEPGSLTRIGRPIVAAALLVQPLALAALLFDFDWVRIYCIFSTLVTVATLLVFLNVPAKAVLKSRDWLIIAAGGMLTGIVAVGGMLLAGSSAHAILDAVLFQSADIVRNWYLPFYTGRLGLLLAVVSVVAAAAFSLAETRPQLHRYRDPAVVLLKIGFVLCGGILFARRDDLFRALSPFCWLIMVGSSGIHHRHPIARGMAGLIGATMSFYPFPVAGHQIAIASLVPIMMMPILAHDLLTTFLQRNVGKFLPAWSRSGFLATTIAAVIGTAATAQAAREYRWSVPLGFPGTSLIRIHEHHAEDLRWIMAQLSACGSSYSLPESLSFAFWTNRFPVTAQHVNDVLGFIKNSRQQEIVNELAQEPDLCVVYNLANLKVLDRGQMQTDPPLLHFVLTELVPFSERDGYIILKRRIPTP